MKITVNAGELLAGLRGPSDRAKISTVIPILKHIHFKSGNGAVHLLGHDLDSSSEALVETDGGESGECCLPAEPLVRLIGGLPKAATVIIEVDAQSAIIKSGRSRYKLPILSAKDMPDALSAEDGFKFTATKTDLEQLFSRPCPALDTGNGHAMCHGVFIHNEAGKLASVATDRHMLMRFSTDISAKKFKGAIIHKSNCDEILKIGAGEVTISDRIISISDVGRVYSSKLIDAVFPEIYRRTITEPGTPITIDREALLECLSRLASIGTYKGSDLLDINVGAGEITISMIGLADGSETLECEADQCDGKFICLSAGQLIPSLKAMRGETVQLHIKDPSTPFRIIDPSEPEAINMLMPCASQNQRAKAA